MYLRAELRKWSCLVSSFLPNTSLSLPLCGLTIYLKTKTKKKKPQATKWDTSGFSIQYSRDIDEHGETQVIKIQKVGGVY